MSAFQGNMRLHLSYRRSILNVSSKVWLLSSTKWTKQMVLQKMEKVSNPLYPSQSITPIIGFLLLLGLLDKIWELMNLFLRKIFGTFKKKSKMQKIKILITLVKCLSLNPNPTNVKYAELSTLTTNLTLSPNFIKNYIGRATAKPYQRACSKIRGKKGTEDWNFELSP